MLLAAAVVAGVIALSERQGARDRRHGRRRAQRLGAQALTEERLDQALRLASAGVALDDSAATRSSLLSTLLRSPAAIGVLRTDGEEALLALALSPDGKTLAVSDADGTVTLFDTETYEVIGDHQAPGTAYRIAFDPQGDSLAVAEDSSANGTLEILDAATGRVRSSTSLAAGRGFANFGMVFYAPDGRSLLVPYYPRVGALLPASVRRPPGHAARKARTRCPASNAAAHDPGRAPPGPRRPGRQGDRRGNASRHPPLPRRRRERPQPRRAHAAISADDGGIRLLDLASGRVRTMTGPRGGRRPWPSAPTGVPSRPPRTMGA